MLTAVVGQFHNHLFSRYWVEETCGSHLHGGCPRQHKFHNVGWSGDSSHADYRNPNRARSVVDHAQRDGLNGWTGEPGSHIGNPRPARLGIDGHRYESIHQRDGVGARFLRYISHLRDRGHVGRELDYDRPPGGALRGSNHFVEQERIAAELNTSMRRIRAGHVNFVGRYTLALIKDFNRLLVVGTGKSEDVGQDDYVFLFAQRRQFLREERLRANVLQANSIQHPGSGFVEPWRRIARHRFFGEALDH